MELVHSVWDKDNFYIWVETFDTLFGRKNFQTDKRTIANSTIYPYARNINQILKILQLAGLEDINYNTAKASTIDITHPNSNFEVEALAIPPLEIMDFLLQQLENKMEYFSLSESTKFWMEIAKFVLDIISKERFLPYVHIKKRTKTETSFLGMWKAIFDLKDESKLIKFSQELIDNNFDDSLDFLEARELILSFINTLLDSFIRNKLGVFLPKYKNNIDIQSSEIARDWFQSLYDSDKNAVIYSTNEFDVFLGTLNAWLNKAFLQKKSNPFRLCLKLTPPSGEDTTNVSDSIWKLEYHLQAQNDPSLIVPAKDIWNSKTQTIAFLEKRFENPQERLLIDLGNASCIYSKIEESLQKAFPTELLIEKNEAFEFLENYSQILEDQGFGVLLPAWWKNPPKDVDLSLKLNPGSEGTKTNTGIFRLNSFLNFEWEIAINGTQLSIKEFEKLAELRVPFVRIRGQWIKIDQERINQMLDLIKNKYKRNMISSDEALQLAITEDSDKDSLFDLSMDETPAFRNFAKRIGASSKIELLSTPKNFQGELRQYQIEGFSWMNFLQGYGFGVCLADDMGLGKTIQLIALLLHAKNQKTTLNPSLLICPTSIIGNWLREINRFAPTLNALVYHGPERPNSEELEKKLKTYDIVITTYNLAKRDFTTLNTIDWHNIILDEAQNIKNPHTKQTRAIKKLESKHKIALTGTPIENRLSELWSIIDFLNPSYLSSLKAFNENYIQPIEKNFDKNKIEHLSKIIQPFILRRLKTDKSIINDLPEKMEYNIFCSLTEEQAILYEAVIKDLFEQLNIVQGIQRKGLVLATITKLKQICNHPAQFTHEGLKKLNNRSCKFERLVEMLEEVLSNNEKALIFTQYKELGKMLQIFLKNKFGIEPLFLSGDTSQKNREKMIQAFQEEGNPASPKLFILSIKAGGVGLNLTNANHVFHIDRWWNPAVENQATDRAFRIGQKKNVMVHKFVCIGTLEESIDQLIKQKIGLANAIISSGGSLLTELSLDDLRSVLSLRTIH